MKKQMTLSTDRKSACEGEYIEIRDEGEVVRLQGQHEVLVAIAEEMAEGPLDCITCSLARSALLFNWKKT